MEVVESAVSCGVDQLHSLNLRYVLKKHSSLEFEHMGWEALSLDQMTSHIMLEELIRAVRAAQEVGAKVASATVPYRTYQLVFSDAVHRGYGLKLANFIVGMKWGEVLTTKEFINPSSNNVIQTHLWTPNEAFRDVLNQE